MGSIMWEWAKDLFPIYRSITGDGVRKTLSYLNSQLGNAMTIHEVPSGTQAFDWTVPKEWNVNEAWIKNPQGNKIVDFNDCNLHLVGYSIPVDIKLPLEELQEHLHSLSEQPDAIPYITSYYQERWGFCLTENQRRRLPHGYYHVHIDSSLKKGSLTYGEILIPGETEEEVLLSTFVCHPSMANNELSGPVVTTALARWLLSLASRRYSYRIVFIPETIGSIVYLSRNLDVMKYRTVAGFVVSCIGDERNYSLLHTPFSDTLADKVATHVFKHHCPGFFEYSFLERGSDERQYCSPGVRLPVVTVMRTKPGKFDEYHTSKDDLTLVTPEGLQGGFDVLMKCLMTLEANKKYDLICKCEPQLGKRGLYPTLSTKESGGSVRDMMNLLAYADGTRDLVDIAELIGSYVLDVQSDAEKLLEAGLLLEVKEDVR